MKWWVVAVLALAAGAVGVLIGLGINSDSTSGSVGRLGSTHLQDEKLRQQVRQLQISNAQNSSPLHLALAWAPFVTALGAIAAVGGTLWKQTSDLAAARTQLH